MVVTVILLSVLLVAALYVFLVMPRAMAKPDVMPVLCDYAHRGLHKNGGGVPENSMGAFKRAVDLGVGIELDVQLTKDGRVVVFHDETLERMCGKRVRVCDVSYEQLKKERLLGSSYGIPLFSEVLELVDGRVPLLIELKGESLDDSLCWKLAPLLDRYGGEFCVQSFNPVLLRWFSKHREDVIRGQLVTRVSDERGKGNRVINFMLTHMLLNWMSRPDIIMCDGRYRDGLEKWVCKNVFRTPFIYWTVQKRELLAYNHRKGIRSIFEGFEP
jgi:glycerophosphoryl diester phosphodiesterase